jgi:hypothetical protein
MPRYDREDAEEASLVTALRALLTEIVDYAGLFPPAALDMRAAAQNYARYRSGTDSWMLGRFVLPASRLADFAAARAVSGDVGAGKWPLSVLLESDVRRGMEEIDAFRDAQGDTAIVDCAEVKLASPEAIANAARLVVPGLTLFVEVSARDDLAVLVAAMHDAGVSAKIRTGGVIADAIPSAPAVLDFLRRCAIAGVPFKATAGLHHPIRADYPLTYAPDAACANMFGFLNVFLAAAAIRNGMGDADALQLLEERNPRAFAFAPDRASWRGHGWTAEELSESRRLAARSFGSCSFDEPVAELAALGFAS